MGHAPRPGLRSWLCCRSWPQSSQTKTDKAVLKGKVLLATTAVGLRAKVRLNFVLGAVLVVVIREISEDRRAREEERPPHRRLLSHRPKCRSTWRWEGLVINEWIKPSAKRRQWGLSVSGQVCSLREHQGWAELASEEVLATPSFLTLTRPPPQPPITTQP